MIFNTSLKTFATLTPEQVEDSLFKSRYDTKYLLHPHMLPVILQRMTGSYRVLLFNGQYIQEYQSLYFDNHRFQFYQDHQKGKLNRYKVRFRRYAASGSAFVEIKFKSNKHRTQKWRSRIQNNQYGEGILTGEDQQFIGEFLKDEPGPLFPRFQVTYRRLALLHRHSGERITIDLGLSYTDVDSGETKTFPNIAIAEVKHAEPSPQPEFRRIMREERIMPSRFSKYCFGVYLFYPHLKHNRFKPRYLNFRKKYNH